MGRLVRRACSGERDACITAGLSCVDGRAWSAGMSYSRWAVELGAAVEYAGLDAPWQHLAMFKLAQLVRVPQTWQFLYSLHRSRAMFS